MHNSGIELANTTLIESQDDSLAETVHELSREGFAQRLRFRGRGGHHDCIRAEIFRLDLGERTNSEKILCIRLKPRDRGR